MNTNLFRSRRGGLATDGAAGHHNATAGRPRLRAAGAMVLAVAGVTLAPVQIAVADAGYGSSPGVSTTRDADRGRINAGPGVVAVPAGKGTGHRDGNGASAATTSGSPHYPTARGQTPHGTYQNPHKNGAAHQCSGG